jgi:hypothetical protein
MRLIEQLLLTRSLEFTLRERGLDENEISAYACTYHLVKHNAHIDFHHSGNRSCPKIDRSFKAQGVPCTKTHHLYSLFSPRYVPVCLWRSHAHPHSLLCITQPCGGSSAFSQYLSVPPLPPQPSSTPIQPSHLPPRAPPRSPKQRLYNSPLPMNASKICGFSSLGPRVVLAVL